MSRTTRLIVLAACLILVLYQHMTIRQLTKQTNTFLHQMETEYGKRVDEVQKLMVEKSNLEQELSQAKSQLSLIEQTLSQAQHQLAALGDADQPLIDKIKVLLQSREVLEKRVASLTSEKELLEKKFQDPTALKQAIKAIKRQQREKKKSLLHHRDHQLLAAGNRGFLVKDGMNMLQSHRSVEVTPAPLPAMAKEGQI